jgi:multidrug efflux pump subunit AcrB
MCGVLLRPHEARREGRLLALLEAGFQRTLGWYAASLRWALRHRLFMVIVIAVTVAANGYLYIVIPKGFFPQQDAGIIQCVMEAGQDISYNAMVERSHAMAKVVMADPDVRAVYYWVGANPTVVA